jgi:hypothetical protein
LTRDAFPDTSRCCRSVTPVQLAARGRRAGVVSRIFDNSVVIEVASYFGEPRRWSCREGQDASAVFTRAFRRGERPGSVSGGEPRIEQIVTWIATVAAALRCGGPFDAGSTRGPALASVGFMWPSY